MIHEPHQQIFVSYLIELSGPYIRLLTNLESTLTLTLEENRAKYPFMVRSW